MNFEDHDRKSLDFFAQTVTTNMDFNDSAIKDSEGSEKQSKENLFYLREYFSHYKLTICRKDSKIAGVMSLQGNERHYWKLEENSFYKVASNSELAMSYNYMENKTSDKLGYFLRRYTSKVLKM